MKPVLFLVAALSLGLAGCVVVPEYPAAHVVISGGHPVQHCPPGQAKKGRC